MKPIHVLIIDCDGVLTDGKVYHDNDGERSKAFHARDNRAIRDLVAGGFEVIIFTQSSWTGLKNFADRVGATIVSKKDKQLLHPPKTYFMVGDDTPDITLLINAKVGFCPADAHQAVLAVPGIEVLKTRGGEGVIAELLDRLIKPRTA